MLPKEEILHSLWKYQVVHPLKLKTVEGMTVEIAHPGNYNRLDSGPDFFNAKVFIGDNCWAGNIEIHVKSSDWIRHLHHFDPAYKNVILHVVWEDDLGKMEGLRYIPTIELKNKIPLGVLKKYSRIEKQTDTIICKDHLSEIRRIDWEYWKEKLIIDRFVRKASFVEQIFEKEKHWEKTAFVVLLQSLGGQLNKQPMGMLAQYLSPLILQKESHRPQNIEALLLGVGGFLDSNFSDDYLTQLQEVFSFLEEKYNLQSVPYSNWRYSRLRPANFPNIQLSVLAQNINLFQGLCSSLIAIKTLHDLQKVLLNPANEFWDDRYKMESISSSVLPKKYGKNQLLRIYINAVIPFQMAYNGMKGTGFDYIEILDQLTKLPPEKNRITKRWEELGIENNNLWDAHALMELFNHFCNRKKCLNCSIGIKTLKTEQL